MVPYSLGCVDEDGNVSTGDGSSTTQTYSSDKLRLLLRCAPPQFPLTPEDFERFKKGLCWAESDPARPCDDNAVGRNGDIGRYQFTPIAVKDIWKTYCLDRKTEEAKAICENINKICPGAKNSDPSCAKDVSVADKLLEYWLTGRWPAEKQRKPGETEAEYYYRLLGIFHCGSPKSAKEGCETYDGSLPPSRPEDNYFIKWWCEYKKSGGEGSNPPGWNQDWCKPPPNGIGRP